jgi:ceramide glucosyltransferase
MHTSSAIDFVRIIIDFASLMGCLFLIGACISALCFAARQSIVINEYPAVTILKPLHGLELNLIENLRSFCRQDYPHFQIVFGVQNPADKAIDVVALLKNEFSALAIDIVIDSQTHGRNPKVANLINMLPKAAHNYLVIADSDMAVTPDYLQTVTAPLHDPANGLVTCLYRGQSSGNLWSDLGSMHINDGFLPQALVGDALGSGAGCFGATLALRRDTLNSIGGFEAIANELADDHALGRAVHKVGQKVVLSNLIVDTTVNERSLADMLRHELRWMRTVKFITPSGFIGSVVTHALALAVLATLLSPDSVYAWVDLVTVFCVRGITATITRKSLKIQGLKLLLLPLRDLLSFAVYGFSFTSRHVQWRDASLRIDRSGKIAREGV